MDPPPLISRQSTIEVDGERATGASNTIAHHLSTTEGVKTIMIAPLRYLDTFEKGCRRVVLRGAQLDRGLD